MLRGYIQDKMNAKLMGMQPTGNGRRESFAHMTLPRMTNTYMRAGSRSPEGCSRLCCGPSARFPHGLMPRGSTVVQLGLHLSV